MSNIWITSDTHYNHEGLVKGESEWGEDEKYNCRDFVSLATHNDVIVENINACATKKDWLYHVGDWSLGGRKSVFEFRNRLKCENIVIVLGNHDHHIRRDHDGAHSLFKGVYERLEKNWFHQNYVLDHYPIYSWHKQGSGAIHLYGHVHEELNYHKNAICVSIDCHPEFRPFSLDEINEIINNRNNEYPTGDLRPNHKRRIK